jgi:hypothetical protein
MTRTWPNDGKMLTSCAWCGSRIDVDVSTCIELGVDCRPVDCDYCYRHFELRADGSTIKLTTAIDPAGYMTDVYKFD